MKLYDNARTVRDEASILKSFQERSLLSYQTHVNIRDIHYAQTARSTLDLFPLANADKTVIFIHGGYWQWCEKSDFAFIAAAVLAKNMQCVLLEYDLAPHQQMSEIVSQIQQAFDFIEKQKWISQEVLVVGHSAGAHLTAMMLNHHMIDEAALLSGIYDLGPIRDTHLNTALDLSDLDISQYSPINSMEQFSKNYTIYYGNNELEELTWQSQLYFQKRQKIDQDFVNLYPLHEIDHYNILDEYFHNILK